MKQAVFVYIFYMIAAICLFGICCDKRSDGNAEEGSKSLAVFEGYINIPVLSPRYTAPTRALTLKFDAVLIEALILLFMYVIRSPSV